MPDGITVSPEVLHQSASNTRQAMASLPRGAIANMHCDPEAVGDAEFASTMTDFCVRWRVGLEYMTEDGDEVATRLDQSAQRYHDDDSWLKKLFDPGSWF